MSTLVFERQYRIFGAMFNFEYWQKNWDSLGKDDPLWVVLTDDSKKGERWDREEFFATGRKEIGEVLEHVRELEIPLGKERALDFGCGVGRLSSALAEHFEEVHGVDISPSMIEHANRLNRHPGRCHFAVNSRPDLSRFSDGSFDFIYTALVLQHIAPEFSRKYMAEFLRLLKPGGVIVFQWVSATLPRRVVPRFLQDVWRRIKHRGKPFICMFAVPEREVLEIINRGGGTLLRHDRTPYTWKWISHRVFVQKKPKPAESA